MDKPIGEVIYVVEEEEFVLPCDRVKPETKEESIEYNDVEPTMEQFPCLICNVIFITRLSLAAHNYTVHSGIRNSFACFLCKKKLTTRIGLRRHDDAMHKKLKPYKCGQCSYKAASEYMINRHRRNVHEKKFKCGFCNYTCSAGGILACHVHVKHERLKLYNCSRCNYTFPDTRGLSEHFRRIHKTSPFVASLNVVAATPPRTGTLSKLKIFRCTELYCIFATLTKSGLDDHVTQIHG